MPLFYLLGIWWGFKISLCHPQEILEWFNSGQGCYRSCSRPCSRQESCRKHSRAPTTAGTNSITFSQPQYSPLPETEQQNLRDLFKLLYRFWGGEGRCGCIWGFISNLFIRSCARVFKDRRKAWGFCSLSCKTQAIDYHSADSANSLKKKKPKLSVKC